MTTTAVDTASELQDFDAYIDGLMRRWSVPAMSVAVVNDGSVLLSRGFGYRDREAQLPATMKTLFAIVRCAQSSSMRSPSAQVDVW